MAFLEMIRKAASSGLRHKLRAISLAAAMALFGGLYAQEQQRPKGIFFPTPMYERNWFAAVGFQTFAMPEALTEEFRLRVPAGDVQLLRQIHGGFHLNARGVFQILQNHAAIGLNWATPLNERWNFSTGGSVGFWKGRLEIEGFDTAANGWAGYPHVTLGYKAGNNILATLRTEAILKLDQRTRVGDHEIGPDINTFNGMAWSLYLEQPFFGDTHIGLGFTARYTNFFWATWALFNEHEKPLLFRQITIAFIP